MQVSHVDAVMWLQAPVNVVPEFCTSLALLLGNAFVFLSWKSYRFLRSCGGTHLFKHHTTSIVFNRCVAFLWGNRGCTFVLIHELLVKNNTNMQCAHAAFTSVLLQVPRLGVLRGSPVLQCIYSVATVTHS